MLPSKFLKTILAKFMTQQVMETVATKHFSKLLNSWVKNLAGKKLVYCAQNPKTAKAKRIELLKFGIKEVKNFVQDPDKSIKPKIIHIIPNGPTHTYGMECTVQIS